MISLLVSNISYSVMICGCWWGEFVAWSTSTSCQTSALQSFPFLLLRTNFAANSLPVAFSLHLFTTAYCPLKIKYYFPSNDRQINWPYSRDELNCQLTCRFHHKYRRSFQSVRCKEPLPFLKLFANRSSGNQALLLLVVGPQHKIPAGVGILRVIELSHVMLTSFIKILSDLCLRSFESFA